MALIGVPLKVLHEAEGHIITVETTSGEVSPFILLREVPLVLTFPWEEGLDYKRIREG
jgi:hypothetical protein